METINIISSILIYLVLPVVILLGIIILFRRKRQKDAGQINSINQKPINKEDFRSIKEDEAYDARHTKSSPKNVDPETGRQPEN